MDRTAVRSSNIRAIGYDPQSQTLEVEFTTGGVYQYSGVPDAVYQGLMRAGSKGAYFHAHVKDRYPCLQVR